MKKRFRALKIFIAVVGVIVVILGAYLIPSFARAREEARTFHCAGVIRLIEAMKDQWTIENNAKDGQIVVWADILPYLKSGVEPVCPSGGTYTIGVVGEVPSCSVLKHRKYWIQQTQRNKEKRPSKEINIGVEKSSRSQF